MPVTISTPESANLLKWHKDEGDKVSKGDVLLEIETDKAVVEIQAETDGILQKILVSAGTQGLPANEPLGLIVPAGEQPAGSAPAQRSAPVTGAQQNGRILASPLARRLAGKAGVDLGTVSGSGPRGRIVERDIKAAAEKHAAAPAQPGAPAQAAGTAVRTPLAYADAAKESFHPGSYEEVALDGMRRTIAERLHQATQTIPHFYLTTDVELDALAAMRASINADAPRDRDGSPAYKLSINDFVIKALALALQRVPEANAVWATDRLLRLRQSDVGVAVAVDGGGLYTPVLRAAESKALPAISSEVSDLVTRARSRRLRPEEYRGGVTAVSNLGMYGVKEFSAIINPPHSSILAVGRAEQRVTVKNGAPAVVEAMTVTLSCDHRVMDGALGARLLAAIKDLIEKPLGMLV